MQSSGAEAGSSPDVRNAYWDEYYSAPRTFTPRLPSQFAVFVAGELDSPQRVVEFGCGNGRDALFFAELGHAVVGVDASLSAIEACQKAASEAGATASFIEASVENPDVAVAIPASDLSTLVYGRFFVHALTEDEEAEFLKRADELTAPGDRFAVEFRTSRDASLPKVTAKHYRRYVKPFEFQSRVERHNFRVEYFTEGFGLAKYRDDDAHVARFVFVKVNQHGED